MTWNEWCNYSNGIHRAKVKEWEHTRTIAWMLYKANSDPKKSAKVMTTWWKLPTDSLHSKKPTRKKGKRLTKKQIEDFFNRMR